MEAIAWVVALGFFYFFAIAPALKKWESNLSAANERLTTLASQVSEIQSGEERSLRRLHNKHDALIDALARIDDPKEMPHLKTHYDLMLELLVLRERGTAEEKIVEEQMNYRPIGSRHHGWCIPIYDKAKERWTIWRFSPYFVATNKVRLRDFADLEHQAREHVRAQDPGQVFRTYGEFDKNLFPGAEERDATVSYRDSSGKDREWPEPAPDAKA